LERSVSDPTPRGEPFRGFTHHKAVDHFAPNNGFGPGMVLEATNLPTGGIEQTLSLDGLKLSVVEERPRPGAAPETLIAVSQRLPRIHSTPFSANEYELVYTMRSLRLARVLTGGAAISLDVLASVNDGAASSVERGEPAIVRPLLETTARMYGASVSQLVDAVQFAAPKEIGDALAAVNARAVEC